MLAPRQLPSRMLLVMGLVWVGLVSPASCTPEKACGFLGERENTFKQLWTFVCDMGDKKAASFNAQFESKNNDKYKVRTGWCSSESPSDYEAECTWRNSQDFKGPLIFAVEDGSMNDDYDKNIAVTQFICKNWAQSCVVDIWRLSMY